MGLEKADIQEKSTFFTLKPGEQKYIATVETPKFEAMQPRLLCFRRNCLPQLIFHRKFLLYTNIACGPLEKFHRKNQAKPVDMLTGGNCQTFRKNCFSSSRSDIWEACSTMKQQGQCWHIHMPGPPTKYWRTVKQCPALHSKSGTTVKSHLPPLQRLLHHFQLLIETSPERWLTTQNDIGTNT